MCNLSKVWGCLLLFRGWGAWGFPTPEVAFSLRRISQVYTYTHKVVNCSKAENFRLFSSWRISLLFPLTHLAFLPSCILAATPLGGAEVTLSAKLCTSRQASSLSLTSLAGLDSSTVRLCDHVYTHKSIFSTYSKQELVQCMLIL